ncbi:MAG TPA: Type 1 glutamine amidotransferase-like domain-containing protein [Anaerolineales bacterium]|jgi:peptidase E
MPTRLHLFSSPGNGDISYTLDACRTYLEGKDDPLVAYLPLASLSGGWLSFTEKAFRGLGRLETLNSETMTFAEMEAILRRAHVLYIPGGNTFLLSHRLHTSRWMEHVRKKVQAGLPLVAFSAGSILCGPNILTSRDMNMLETPHFGGLNLLQFNLHVHYEDEPYRDDWLADYHVFQLNPVILLADGAHLRVENKKTSLVRGEAWVLRKGQQKEKLEAGQEIST